ncbi:MAG TPA: hypothetical protein ENN22_13615 [bacterium]|nr:hypothetical protein [bacterium]
MRFVVDVMLGKLARWLRILGYDTIYQPDFSDDDLFFCSYLENRVLLTRDRALAGRMHKDRVLLLNDTDLKSQLTEVVQCFDLKTEGLVFSRCTICNQKIIPVEKAVVADRVPAYIFDTICQFYYCQNCDKVYWEGSHLQHAKQFLKKLKGRNGEQK